MLFVCLSLCQHRRFFQLNLPLYSLDWEKLLIFMSFWLSIYIFIYLSIYLSIKRDHDAVRLPSIYMSVHFISIYLSIFLSIYLWRETMIAVGDRVTAINDSNLDNIKSAQVRKGSTTVCLSTEGLAMQWLLVLIRLIISLM